jgi:hypothetical protein
MLSRCMLRATLGIVLCLAVNSSGFGQVVTGPCSSTNSSSTGCNGHTTAIVLAASGAAVVVAILYLMHRKPRQNQTISQASIVGCVEKTEGGAQLKNEKDHQTYGIIADTLDLQSGERVELAGKKFKDREGKLNMDVQTLVKDYGPCSP